MDAQIARLRAIRERLSRANTPEERQALMAERAKVMQDAMGTMHRPAEWVARAECTLPLAQARPRPRR